MDTKTRPALKPGVVTGDDYKALVAAAKEGGYALPAVNVANTNTANAVMEAAANTGSDVIIQLSNGGAQFFAGQGLPDAFQAKVLGAVSAARHVHLLAEHYGRLQALFVAFEDDFKLIVKAYMPGGKPWCVHFTRGERDGLRQSGRLNARSLLDQSSRFSSTLPTPGDVLHLFDGSRLRFQVMDRLLASNLPVQ